MKISNITYTLLFSLTGMFLLSCSRGASVVPAEPETVTMYENQGHKIGGNAVEVDRIAAKGKIMASARVPVYPLVDGVLEKMNVMEGQKLRKGQIIARIDRSEAEMTLSELESDLRRKEYDVQSRLVGLGYRRDQLGNVPSDVLESIRVMTGYSHASLKVQNQKKIMSCHDIKAPIDGSIMDVKVGEKCYVRKGDPLFYILDTENLILQFEVLETMLPAFKVGMPLEFTALALGDTKFEAVLVSIAPNVESNGMVSMVAGIKEKYSQLLPGMTIFVNY